MADAELVMVAYGISARVAKEAVKIARKKGLRLGLIRPKAIVPFPVKAFAEISPDCKGLLLVEMSIYGYCSSFDVPESEKAVALAEDILAGKVAPLRAVKEV